MSEKKDTFHYSYSARQQEEIRKIREKYIPKEESKMEQLRQLDESATRPGTIAAIVVGIIGALLLGIGMCCTMVWAGQFFIPGIIIGVIGIAVVIAAYPIYNRITGKRREKLAPEIMRLTDELSQK
ncbi:MAG: hypothetical protein ACLRVS_00300 [Lachnospiraceae bacterium]